MLALHFALLPPNHFVSLVFLFADYSDTKIQRCLNAELANTFGNLLSRGCAKSLNHRHVFPKLRKADFVQLLEIDATGKLVDLVAQLPGKIMAVSEIVLVWVAICFILPIF